MKAIYQYYIRFRTSTAIYGIRFRIESCEIFVNHIQKAQGREITDFRIHGL